MLYIKWWFRWSNLYPFIVNCGQNETLVNVITGFLKQIMIKDLCCVFKKNNSYGDP